MANPDYGFCTCPVCKHPRAAVRVAANNKTYTSCDECLSSVRTLSGRGDREIRSWITEMVAGAVPVAAPAAPVAETPPPAAVATVKKSGGFADALNVLTGGK